MITQYADIMMNPSWGWYALHLSWISVNIWYETKPDDVTWYDTWWYEHDMIPVSACKTNLTTKNWVRQGDPSWCAWRCPRCVKQHRSIISFALRCQFYADMKLTHYVDVTDCQCDMIQIQIPIDTSTRGGGRGSERSPSLGSAHQVSSRTITFKII